MCIRSIKDMVILHVNYSKKHIMLDILETIINATHKICVCLIIFPATKKYGIIG